MATTVDKKTKTRYLNNKPAKRGGYAIHPGVQGFFITCDGGKERQASHEAVNVIDSFYEELMHGTDSDKPEAGILKQASNKKTKFVYSSGDEDDNDDSKETEKKIGEGVDGDDKATSANVAVSADKENQSSSLEEVAGNKEKKDNGDSKETEKKIEEGVDGDDKATSANVALSADKENQSSSLEEVAGNKENKELTKNNEVQEEKTGERPAKKQRVEIVPSDSSKFESTVMKKKSVDELIESELAELGDKSKRRFFHLDSGCNGVAFVQMRKREGDPSPKDIVQYMMTSLAKSRKHVSRYMLRVLPVEVSCYASEEEISVAIKPLIAQHFPVETENPKKYAVLYDARANTGVDRAKIIDAVAKSVPAPHKVDLGNPDVNITVQIVKTVCLIGLVEKYKEFSKFNVRQLTSNQSSA